MATQAQIEYYRHLCEQACIEPDEECEDWSTEVTSEKISELKEIVGG